MRDAGELRGIFGVLGAHAEVVHAQTEGRTQCEAHDNGGHDRCCVGIHEEERHDAHYADHPNARTEQTLSLETLGNGRNEDRARNAHDREEGNAGGDRLRAHAAFSKNSGEPGYEAEEEDRLNAEETRYPPGERLLQEMLADQGRRMQAKYPMLGRALRRSHHAARYYPE